MKQKKFTKRQKIILLTAVICFLLVIIITPIVITIQERKQKSTKLVSNQKEPNEDNKGPDIQKLTEKRNKAITTLEKEIENKNVSNDNLLSELKSKLGLSNTETD